jgi:hypothetical protein
MTEREGRALPRRRPDVKHWAQLLKQARDRCEETDQEEARLPQIGPEQSMPRGLGPTKSV